MTKIVLVEKNGNKKNLNAKGLTREALYKKCGFRKTDDFEKRHSWEVKNNGVHSVEVWARNTGRANTENKYDLPPPIDTELYFGTIAVVGVDSSGEITDMDVEQWNKIYEQLFGGFDDLDDDDDDDEEDELEHIPKELKTKVGGYMKDGFVVDADESDEEDEGEGFGSEALDDDDEESEEESEEDSDDEDLDDMLSDVGSELQEEDYLYSDDEQ
uniref:Uncharacterized protein n=1 Tax=viral metagenome TaxID=1070528 RepID=A0A6C0CS90_9ZZZZ